MSAADWDLVLGSKRAYPTPRRDMVATDGQTLTLGASLQRGGRHERRRRADRESSEPGRRGGEAVRAGQAEAGRSPSFRDRNATIQRYLTMVRECAQAGLATSR